MTVHGPHTITFPPKHEWDRYCHDGHGGPPYRMFAVGTTPAAAPGGSYTGDDEGDDRSSGTGRVKLTMSCSDWGTKSQYSTLAGSSREVISHAFGTNYETVTGMYTAPNDENAWFIQGSLEFADATDVDVSYFSIKRTQTSDTTEDFQVALNGKTVRGRRTSSSVSRRRNSRSVPWIWPTATASSGSRRRSRATTTAWRA